MKQRLNIAVIGLGHRASYLGSLLDKLHTNFQLKYVVDPNKDYSVSNLSKWEINHQNVEYFGDIETFLKFSHNVDGIIIGSPCNQHTTHAINVKETGLPIYLEKPVATTFKQIEQLKNAYKTKEHLIVVSFPLSQTPLFKEVQNQIGYGKLGAINQVHSNNNVPYGALYYGYSSYRDYSVSGGLWLQKATHDFDYINKILGVPISITAMMNRSVYGGDMPKDLWCSKCDFISSCTESPEFFTETGNSLAEMGDHQCVWAKDIIYQDAGSSLIMYESGAHANYSQNFVSRFDAASRGARITGYNATILFDWYTNKISIIDHMNKSTEEIIISNSDGHHGGDTSLLKNFADVCLGKDISNTDLNSGLLSAAMCLSAKKACHEQSYISIGSIDSSKFPYPENPPVKSPINLEPV